MPATLGGEESPWMTKREAADYLRVGHRTVDHYVTEGRLVRHSIAGKPNSPRFARAEVEALVLAPVAADADPK